MDNIFEIIQEKMKESLINFIIRCIDGMYDGLNTKVSEIGGEVAKTPKLWNSEVFNMIKGMSESVIVPIAGSILTIILIYELIYIINEHNNMRDFDSFIIFKWIIKSIIGIYLVTNVFDIINGIYDVSYFVVQKSTKYLNTQTSGFELYDTLENIRISIEEYDINQVVLLSIQILLSYFIINIMAIVVDIILVSRMIEIYIYMSIAPIPFATFMNKETKSIGENYLKGIIALGLQGFFIMICVAIYTGLVNAMQIADGINTWLAKVLLYSIVLIFTMLKTSAISKSIFNAH